MTRRTTRAGDRWSRRMPALQLSIFDLRRTNPGGRPRGISPDRPWP